MSKYYCLISQKETKERNKLKCLIIGCDETPEDYVSQLQENHCMEYQLVIYSMKTDELVSEIDELCKDKKTGYGKNWYELTDSDLAAAISTYFRCGKVIFDFTSIADIVQHTLNFTSIGGDERVRVIPDLARPNLTLKFHQESITDHVPVAPAVMYKDPSLISTSVSSVPVTASVSTPVSSVSSVPTADVSSEKTRGFEVKIKDVSVTKKDYQKFISEKCIKDDKSRIQTIKLNDSFIDYIVENNPKLKLRDFNSADDRELLFKGFIKLGYETIDSGKRYYVKGLRLKTPQ
jgi:hypothetical protein